MLSLFVYALFSFFFKLCFLLMFIVVSCHHVYYHHAFLSFPYSSLLGIATSFDDDVMLLLFVVRH